MPGDSAAACPAKRSAAWPAGRRCACCGQLVLPSGRCPNAWCAAADRALAALYWSGRYEAGLRRALLAYKRHGDLRWGPVLAAQLARFVLHHPTWFEEDAVLCPVPAFTGPGARRTWAPVPGLCAALGRALGGMWPVEHLLVKRAETPPMGAMGARHRRACARLELSGALEVAPGALATLAGARVLLVDDVCASGHTLLSAAAVLRRCGASEVTGLVVARAFLRAGPWAAGP